MAETRTQSPRYEDMAKRLIEGEPLLEHIRESHVRIAYLESDNPKRSKGRTVRGECEKVPAKWQWCCPHDFLVTVYGPNVAGFTEEQLRILLLHELMHVGIDLDEDFEETYSLVAHDYEEFAAIVERFGADWAKGA